MGMIQISANDEQHVSRPMFCHMLFLCKNYRGDTLEKGVSGGLTCGLTPQNARLRTLRVPAPHPNFKLQRFLVTGLTATTNTHLGTVHTVSLAVFEVTPCIEHPSTCHGPRLANLAAPDSVTVTSCNLTSSHQCWASSTLIEARSIIDAPGFIARADCLAT